ncbi:hypothetical protein [Asaia prunellae]|uniref:hypothetical protein n=1 Tax=Asaia prunellae TaxID=610245 RepID=UPI00131EDED3|nr:hypothetical protein [Asaia prunellae]
MSGSFLPEVKSTAGPSARFTGSASSSMRADTTVKTGWTPMRAIIIMLCFGVNMVDGVDVLMLSYVAPTLRKARPDIRAAWHALQCRPRRHGSGWPSARSSI